MELPPAIPAATLIVMREGAGAPELLMVERAKAMAFAGGMMVFPGGRIDPGDYTLGGDDEAAARIAAVRETIEEAGLPLGLAEDLAADALAGLRAALHAGTGFGAALAEAGATLDLAALVPWARWRPAHAHMRIFDTRFYLARLPADAPAASVDATENTRLVWITAADALADADAWRSAVIFPTRRNLERLARFASFDDAAAHARATPIRAITPWIDERDGVERLCIPDDLGYDVTSEPLDSAMRG